MTSKKKSWAEKFNARQKPEIEILDKKFADMSQGDKMLIATPKIFDDYIRSIPEGKSVDMLTIRKDLALEHGADNTCPLTTGIFMRIVAEAAYEKLLNGEEASQITPFWRAIAPTSALAKKLSFGTEYLIERREEENIAEVKIKKGR